MKNTETTSSPSRKRGLWWLALGALVIVEATVFFWLRPDKERWDSAKRLQISIVENRDSEKIGSLDYHFLDQPKRLTDIANQLSFSGGICGLFAPDGQAIHAETPTLELFFFEYEAGNPLFIEDVLGHAPEVCMKASGAILKQVHPVRELPIEDQSLEVRVLEFETPVSSIPLWVFRLTWLPEDSPYKAAEDAAMLRKERLMGGILGNPRPPARVILAGARNFRSEQSAWDAFYKLVGKKLFLRAPIKSSLPDS